MRQFHNLFFLCNFCILAICCKSEIKNSNTQTKITMNIKDSSFVSPTEFNKLINSSIEKCNQFEKLNVQDFILMTRLYNTISINNEYLNNANCKLFYNLYKEKIIHKCIEILDAKITKGMCYYSKKHDIYIGCKPHLNSHFIIKKK